MTKLFLTTALATALLSTPSIAQNGPENLSLTVYNSQIALVSDTRSVSLRPGEQVIELPGVSSQIQPTTVTFGLRSAEILEQNFDFDLLSPQKLMEKHLGKYVEVIRTNPGNGNVTTDRAKVLSVNNGVIVQIGSRIEVLSDDDIPTRVVFPDVPENLRARPTLSIRVDATQGGRQTADLSYLSGGMDWRSDYVARYDEAADTLDLQGWATLTNNTETTFENADVAVVAGQVNSSAPMPGGSRFIPEPPRYGRPDMIPGMETGTGPRLGDNYIYPLPGKITVRANQTKQVGIVDATGVTAEKAYSYRAQGFNTGGTQSANVRIAFTNDGDNLPAGTVRVYQEDTQGRSQFVGEDTIVHTPRNSRLGITIGQAFDVRVQQTLEKRDRISDKVAEYTMRYRFTNARPKPVSVEFQQMLQGGSYTSYEILRESEKNVLETANYVDWKIDVPANGSTDLTFTIRERRN